MARGHENIKPNAQRTPEELRAMGSKGGKASVEAKKRRKATQQKIADMLEARPKIAKARLKELEETGIGAIEAGELTAEHIMLAAILKKAMDGDEVSADFIYRYGLKPTMRDKNESARIKAMKAVKQPAAGRDDPLVQLLQRIDAEAAEGGGAP